MQEDSFPAAERILSDIESVFLKDPELKEFDILPVTLNQNKSPVHHVENCLGLELWCVRHVYCYAYHHLFGMRQQKNRRADPEVQARLLMGALLLNPDVQTFWNMRRELVQACRLDCHNELHFTAVVLSRKPKCSEAFSYRKWIVTKLVAGGEKGPSLLTQEIEVARAAANRYANNYHAWQHTIWSLVHLTPNDICGEMYLEEWETTKKWVSMHISDHSGWQYRQYLLQQLCGRLIDKISPSSVEDHLWEYIHPLLQSCKVMNQCNLDSPPTEVSDGSDQMFQHSLSGSSVPDFKECSGLSIVKCLNIVLSEIYLSTDLITRYPGHEALWYHRRFLLSFLKSLLEQSQHDICQENSDCSEKSVYFRNKSTLSSVNFDSQPMRKECSILQPHESDVSQQPMSIIDTNTAYARVREVLKLIAQALPRHEEQLLSSCVGGDLNQQRFCSQYNKWLVQVLGLPVAF